MKTHLIAMTVEQHHETIAAVFGHCMHLSTLPSYYAFCNSPRVGGTVYVSVNLHRLPWMMQRRIRELGFDF